MGAAGSVAWMERRMRVAARRSERGMAVQRQHAAARAVEESRGAGRAPLMPLTCHQKIGATASFWLTPEPLAKKKAPQRGFEQEIQQRQPGMVRQEMERRMRVAARRSERGMTAQRPHATARAVEESRGAGRAPLMPLTCHQKIGPTASFWLAPEPLAKKKAPQRGVEQEIQQRLPGM